jgi:hypothetical protein
MPDLVGNEAKGCEYGAESRVLVKMRNSDPEDQGAVIPGIY